jgi:hypothetical protein
MRSPSFEFNPSLPLLDPAPVSNILQSPGAVHTEASGLFVDNVCLHRTTGQSDVEDSEDARKGRIFFRRLSSNGISCSRMAGMHLSFVYVNYSIVRCFSRLVYLYLFPDSMTNLSIEPAPSSPSRKARVQTFFGQLQSIVDIPISKSKELEINKLRNICLAIIRQVHATLFNAQGVPMILFYSQSGALDIADIKSIQCVVGRFEDREMRVG